MTKKDAAIAALMVLNERKQRYSELCKKRETLEKRQYSREIIESVRTREKRLHLHISETERALTILSDEQRRILQEFYIERKKGFLNRLCHALYVEKSTLYRMKDKALEAFADALYKKN